MRGWPRRTALLALVAAATLLMASANAQASFPGQNGKFVFSTYDTELDQLEVCTENPDGTGRSCFADSANDSASAWSADGLKLAITGWAPGAFDDEVFSTSPTGSARTNLTNHPAADFEGTWPAGSSSIAFTSFRDGNLEIYQGVGFPENRTNNPAADFNPAWSSFERLAFTSDRAGNENVHSMGPNGNDQKQLTHDPASDSSPNWSPDGSRIAFISTRDGNSEIYSMAADGSDETRLTTTETISESDPAWAPDGTKIAFLATPACQGAACAYADIRQMDPDGSNNELLIGPELDNRFVYGNLDWQPRPVEGASTHIRPKAANPLRASLVPAAQPCTAPNREHGPPLAHPSCGAVQPASPYLTVGGGLERPAKSVGSLTLKVLLGAPGPPHDTDVAIRFSLTNVMSKPSLSDYTGELRVRLGSRVTAKEPPGVGGPTAAGTSVDFPYEFNVMCTATSDPALGASCTRNTSFLAVQPNSIPAEGGRAVWALDAVQVFDGGADGDGDTTEDNALLATQGVFVP